jgi:hypothetical protein
MKWLFKGVLVFVMTVGFEVSADEADAGTPGDDEQLTRAEARQAEERDELEPAVPLAADVRRTEASSGVMDQLDLGRSEITGNQELPKVLYIVPWKKSDPGDLMGRPVNTLLDEVLAPVDRTEFVRQVDYYGDLHGDKEE